MTKKAEPKKAAPVFLKINGKPRRFGNEAAAQRFEVDQDMVPGYYDRLDADREQQRADDNDHRARLEALALRHALTLTDAGERQAALDRLDAATCALCPWVLAVRHELDKGAAVGWAEACAILTGRPTLSKDLAALKGFNLAAAVDPAEARKAFDAVLADTKRAGEARCMEAALAKLEAARDTQDPADRARLRADAVHELTRAANAQDKPLADVWEAHLAAMAAPEAGPDEVLRLQNGRGPWADWFNDNLGSRGGLEPGQTFILGGAPSAGKTSLAALLAVDALAVGCPVTFWQMELNREETLEHLQAQYPDPPACWWKGKFWDRAKRPMPADWADLLTVPRWPEPEAEAVRDALLAQANRARRCRHKCRGLVIVDYMQLMTAADKTTRESRFEVLEKVASRLAKAAGESGACLLLLSQLNKQDQKDKTDDGTALAGADLARMAHRVALLRKADKDGKPTTDPDAVATEAGKGEARLLTWTKARGVRYTPDGHRPDRARLIWNGGQSRALHGGDTPEPKRSRYALGDI